MHIEPTGEILGATVSGIDLRQPLSDVNFAALLRALGDYGVLRFPEQLISAAEQKQFSARFGELHVLSSSQYFEPGMPEVTILSNVRKNGKLIGKPDAGQFWHTDMTYNRVVGFVNVLVAHAVPRRDGKPLGNTEFCSMHAAYDALPDAIKAQLKGKTITHDFNKFWENMRQRPGSTRPPLTEAQRRAKPPAVHPALMIHPITQRRVLYANPGYSIRINELPEPESDQLLAFLFEHQVRPEFRYAHPWKVNTLLMWDNMGTIHNAVPDYTVDEPRLIKRCQVKASRFFSVQ